MFTTPEFHFIHNVSSSSIWGRQGAIWSKAALLLLFFTLLALLPPVLTQTLPSQPANWVEAGEVPTGLTVAEWQTIQETMSQDAYTVSRQDETTGANPPTFVTANQAQGWNVTFTSAGPTVAPQAGEAWRWGLALTGYGYGDALQLVSGRPQMQAKATTLTYVWDSNLSEWWINDRKGLEQGFTLQQRPAGQTQGQPLQVEMAVTGNLTPVLIGSGVQFEDDSGTTHLRYDQLLVVDANGAVVPAHLEVIAATNSLRLMVDDTAATYPLMIDPWVEQAKLTASDAAAGDGFGTSVAVSGDTAVIGAFGKDDGSHNSGAAYVFVRSGSSWSQQAKLTASDAAADDRFGYSVAVSGETAVIGAFGDDDGGVYSGSAYVFVRSGSSWSQQAKLTAGDAAVNDYFGWSVAVSGETAVIGAYNNVDGGIGSGSAYVFVRSGSSWSLQAKLTASDAAAGDEFGISVAVSGETAVIGAYGKDDGSHNIGAAYVFVRSGSSWSQQAKLTASDAARDDNFGISVAVSGETAVIGAYNNNSAYVFTLNEGLSIGDATQTEGDSGTINFNFTVIRTSNLNTIFVEYTTADGTATLADSDYTASSGIIYFPPGGDLTKQVTIQVNGDDKFEADETFLVNLSILYDDGYVVLTDSQGVGTITNDDAVGIIVTESDGDTAVTEGGATDSYTVVLTSQPTADVALTLDPDMQLDLGNGTGNSIDLTFTASDWATPQTVTVTAVDDRDNEGNHSGTIRYAVSSSDTNYDSYAIPNISVTITDNDGTIYIFMPLIFNNAAVP